MIKKTTTFICIFLFAVMAVGCTHIESEPINTSDDNSYIHSSISELEKESVEEPEQIESESPIDLKTEIDYYNQAIKYIDKHKYPQAMGILADLGDYKDSQELLDQLRYLIEGSYISNGNWAVGAINSSERVEVCYSGEDNIYSTSMQWEDIISISFCGGDSIEGLTKDGKIVTTSEIANMEHGDLNMLSGDKMIDLVKTAINWTDIKSFQSHIPQTIVALSNDGYVYAISSIEDNLEELNKLDECEDIVEINDGRCFIIGLNKNGTVMSKKFGYSGAINTSTWEDIVMVSSDMSIIGLKEDGTVVSTGLNLYREGNVSTWTDIISISTKGGCTLGLKSDGTVVAAGTNSYGQKDVSTWEDIVAIKAGEYFSIGLKVDGTMVLAGDCSYSGVKTPDISNMKDLYVPKIS